MRSRRSGTARPLVVVPSQRHQFVMAFSDFMSTGLRPLKVPLNATMPPTGTSAGILAGMAALALPSKPTLPVASPVRLMVRFVARATALPSVRPVPPRPTGSVPLTPGVTFLVPSKEAAVVDARFTRTVRAVAILVAVAALPVQEPDEPDTLVCTGCTWSSLAYLAEVPTAAVPGALGAAVAAVYVVLVSTSPTSCQ